MTQPLPLQTAEAPAAVGPYAQGVRLPRDVLVEIEPIAVVAK